MKVPQLFGYNQILSTASFPIFSKKFQYSLEIVFRADFAGKAKYV